jgi:pimeloyl-ACP methyl ester carboxylesterase
VSHVRKRTLPQIMPATVNVRRSYSDCRFGQMHVCTAYPSGGGFDERTPLICLHMSGGSARAFNPLLPELGRDRSVYSVDLPGHGYSDNAATNASIAEYAGAIGDFANSLRLRAFDIVGIEAGALIAAELAATHPQQLRRAVLISIPYSSQPQRLMPARQDTTTGDAKSEDNGEQLIEDWQRVVKARGAKVPMTAMQSQFADQLRAGAQATLLRNAMQDFPTAQRLPLVRQPTLTICPSDELREQTLRAKSCFSHGSLAELPEFGNGVLASAPLKVAQLIREFFDR